MNTSQMNAYLALTLEDPDRVKYSDKLKTRALNTAQLIVPNLLNNSFLAELRVLEEGETVSSGKAAYSNLASKLLRGNDSIINVKVNGSGGLYFNMLGLNDLKKTENSLFTPSATTQPMGWLFAQGIQTLPTTIAAGIDVFYMKQPTPLNYGYAISVSSGTPASEFELTDVTGVSAVDDFYNGTVIYMKGANQYRVVTNYVVTDRVMTVSPAKDDSGEWASSDGPIYFVPTVDDYSISSNSLVTCDLEATLHDIVMFIAEGICWKIGERLERANTALQQALESINALNQKYEQRENIGAIK